MRTVKASEVVKGMRVRFEASNGDATVTTEGVISEVSGEYAVSAWFGDYGINLNPDHPVTVLAEPEPEWVEGAWYCVQTGEKRREERILRRVPSGWTSRTIDDVPTWGDNEHLTVLGRVLIVDWPGDDVALSVSNGYGNDFPYAAPVNLMLQSVADAIRTQGGAA